MWNVTTANLKFFKGANKVYPLTFTKDEAVVDITNWVVLFTVKAKMDDTDAEASISHDIGINKDYEHTNPTAGESAISLGAVDTNLTPGNYYYDITIKKDAGDVVPIVGGILTVIQRVTLRNT